MNAEKEEKYDRDQNPYQASKEDLAVAENAKLLEDKLRNIWQKGGSCAASVLTNVNWLIPSLAIGYVPLFFFLAAIARINDPNHTFEIFVFSGFFLTYVIPIYAIILIWNTVSRFRNGTNNVAVTLYQLVSLIILIWWYMTVMNFNGSPA